MDERKREQWSAWLDGELPAEEAAEFEASLTPAERAGLEQERGFEAALSGKLRADAHCPELVWKRVEKEMKPAVAPTKRRRTARWAVAAVSAAAALLVFAAAGLWNVDRAEARFLELDARNVEELQAQSETSNCGDEVASLLRGVGVDIRLMLEEIDGASCRPGHTFLLGARCLEYRGEPVAELLFCCCEDPVKVVVARSDGQAGRELAAAMRDGQVQAARHIGPYIAGVVGQHPAHDLLGLIEAR